MSRPQINPNISVDDGIINDEDDFGEEEYESINTMLDQINSYLDDLEERNDALNGKLHELMESNRQARLEFRAQLLGSPTLDKPNPADTDSSLPGTEDPDNDTGGSQMSDKSS
ncbi:hypothetical protein PAMP_013241 [Pampus punctatissimus]